MKITHEESQGNQNGAKNTNRENEGALLFLQFGLLVTLNSQLFGIVTAYNMMELKRNLSLATYLNQKDIIT